MSRKIEKIEKMGNSVRNVFILFYVLFAFVMSFLFAVNVNANVSVSAEESGDLFPFFIDIRLIHIRQAQC